MLWLIVLASAAVWYWCCMRNKDNYNQLPNSYYDEGSWITMPPQRERAGTRNLIQPAPPISLMFPRIYSEAPKEGPSDEDMKAYGRKYKSTLHTQGGAKVKVKPGILYEGYEPAPLNMPQGHTGDLCQECIGHCYLKVWAGVLKVPTGKQEKDFCIDRCELECTELD